MPLVLLFILLQQDYDENVNLGGKIMHYHWCAAELFF